MKRILAILLIMCMGIIPVYASGKEPIYIEMDFDSVSENHLENFETFYGSTLKLVNGADKKGVSLTNDKDDIAVARVNFGSSTDSVLTLRQKFCFSDGKEAQMRIMSEGKSLFAISFSNRQIKAMSANGWVKLSGYVENTWYTVEIIANLQSSSYEVMLNGIKIGSTLNYGTKSSADSVQYSVTGKGAKLILDNICISSGEILTGAKLPSSGSGASLGAGSSSTDSDPRELYYSSRVPYLDSYKAPNEEYVPGLRTAGEKVTFSTETEEFPATNLVDGNDSTKWQAAPPLTPKDNGKSLRLIKPEVGNATLAMQYNFEPSKGVVVVEQDVLVTDVSDEKALPYIYASNGNMAVSLIQSGGVFKLAGGGGTVYRDVSADTWYNIKIVINTESQTYDTYVNGELCLKEASFRERCDDVRQLRYHMSTRTTGGFYVDNIKVSYSSPLQSFEEVIVQQDFEEYEAGTTKPTGWSIGKATGGKIDIDYYEAPSLYTFTQFCNIDLVRESEVEGAYLKIPDGVSLKYTVDVDRSEGTVYETVQDKTDKFYSGEQLVSFSPVRASNVRITIYDAIDAMGNTTYAQLSEFRVILKRRTPVDNLAFNADVKVSGESSVKYDKQGINDNIIAEFGGIGEWRSGDEADKWVELTWDEPQTINRVILHDSAKYENWTKAGILYFSDGSEIEVKDIKNTGYPRDITFDAKTVTSVKFKITDYEGEANISEFQVFAPGGEPEDIEYVEPDIRVELDPEYQSRWVCINDVDNDGELEYVSARIYDDPLFSGNHDCASIAVQEADGTILWKWGDPSKGSKALGSDLPCQVHDLENDGQLEVIAATSEYLYIFNAATGEVKKRYKMPTSEYTPGSWASDTIIFADISGNGYPSDIMVKTRYTEVWAYTKDWKPIWYTCMPEGLKVGHYPQPIDIDNDGHDEVIVGYACIDDDGSVMWSMKESDYPGFISRGHKDSLEVVNFVLTGDTTGDFIINEKDLALLEKHISGEVTLSGKQFTAGDTTGDGKIDAEDKELLTKKLAGELKSFPNKGIPKEDMRFCMSPCGGGANIIMIDGNGDRVWSLDDAVHYETVEKANLGLDDNPYQIITGDNAMGQPAAQLMYLSLDGEILNVTNSFIRNRQFNIINWTGEGGLDYIFMPTDNVLVDGEFKVRVKPLAPVRGYDSTSMKSYQTGSQKFTCDMDGDGTTDIGTITNEGGTVVLYFWYNKNGAKVADGIGRGFNISQY